MSLEERFHDASLDRLQNDTGATGGCAPGVVRAFRKRMQLIRAAPDERVFYEWKSLHFEKLQGDRSNQYSIRLNDQWRLIIEFEGEAPNKTIVIVGIEDYH